MNSFDKEVYKKAVRCNLNCKNIIKDLNTAWIPRGFYCSNSAEKISILIVGKNPGHPLEIERKKYQSICNDNLVETMEKVFEHIWLNSPTIFHKRLLKYLAYFLDIIDFTFYEDFIITKEIFHKIFVKVVKTDLVKCSTKNEQEPLRNFKEDANTCYENYLEKEFMLYNPKNILCLGGEVYDYLNKLNLQFNLLKIKHPSYPYARDKEKIELDHIKNRLITAPE